MSLLDAFDEPVVVRGLPDVADERPIAVWDTARIEEVWGVR